MITLRSYQKEAVESIIAQFDAGVHSTLLAASTGSGKTECFLAWLTFSMDGPHDRALIIAHRKELIDQPFQRIMDHWQSLGIPGIVMANRNETHYATTIATVQTLNSNGRLDEILAHGPITHLVTDECFVAGTLVDGKPIELYQKGDVVTALNTVNYQPLKRKVLKPFKRPAPDVLYEVEIVGKKVVCTPNHPFFCGRSTWKEAKALQIGDYVIQCATETQEKETEHAEDENVHLPLVRRGISDRQKEHEGFVSFTGSSLLQERMQQRVFVQSEIGNNGTDKPQVCIRTDETEQSHASSRKQGKNAYHAASHGVETSTTRREWTTPSRSPTVTCLCSGMGNRGGGAHGSQAGQCGASTLQLQDRYCEPYAEDRHRGGWRFSRPFGAASSGSEKGIRIVSARVDNITVLQRGRDQRFGEVCPDGFVYNLEVEGWHNYLVEGVVVHNCHHSTSATYQNIYKHLREANPDLLHLGVTATPNRTDKDGLSQVYETVAYRASIPAMIKAGALCPFTAYGVKLPVTVEEDDFRDDDKMGDILSLRNAEEVVIETWKEHAEDRPTIAFTASVAQAHSLAAHFREYGYHFFAIDGTSKKDYREMVLTEFSQGIIQGVVNCAVLTEGFDAPHASCLLQVRPTRSDLVYVQMTGRVLRTHPGKDMALILDFVPAGARDMVLAGDLLGRPKEEKKVIDKAEGKTILSVFGINREGNGIDGDPDQVILEVLDYLTRGTSLAWTFDGDMASAGVAQGLSLACVMPDKHAQERVVKAQFIRRGGNWEESWQPTYERLRKLAQYQLYKVEGYHAHCLGVFEDWESCSDLAETFARANGLVRLNSKHQRWRRQPASEKQARLLQRFGKWQEGMKKGQAAQAITHCFARRALGM